ncbi:MAG: protein kinase [Thermoguttaceae bacterium]|nr:protein kinase [Thermoguttaceae bacterium]
MRNDFHSIETDVTITEKEDLELRSLAAGMTLCGEKYRLDRRAGKGGMGIVWKAWDAVGERWVALKFISPEIRHSETAMAQVKTAFQAIQELSHPNICPIYGLENDPGFGCFVVMKWLEGRTLNEAPLPKEKIRLVLEKVATALDHAHSKKVIHRDVKPSNILVADDGEIYLIDFGLARQIRSESQATLGQFSTSGTDKYMAPEQRSGQYQSAQTDEYSLALVALELLTGSLSPMAVTKLSSSVQMVFDKALSDDPKVRYAKCREFVDSLLGTSSDSSDKDTKSAMDELIKAEREAEEAQRRAQQARIQAEEARKRAEEERLRKQIQELENTISEEYKAGKYQEALVHIAELQKLQPNHLNARWLKRRCEKKLKATNSTYTKTKGKRKFLLWLNVLWVIPTIILLRFLIPSPFEMNGTTLVHYKGSAAKVVIPKGVTEIGFFAFKDNESLTTVVIPKGVTKIEWSAFYQCSSLKSVFIPQDVRVIKTQAFKDCPELTIYAPTGSYAEQYAREHNIPFKRTKPWTRLFSSF